LTCQCSEFEGETCQMGQSHQEKPERGMKQLKALQ
jgi:hypothetical protein